MRVGRTGRGAAAGVLLLACIAAGCAASGNGTRVEDDEDLPEFSAARLGDSGSGSLADDSLSPTEREAARDSWATEHPQMKPLDDPNEDDPFAAPPEAPKTEEPGPPKGPFGRAMDATGRFFVSIASVTVSLGMALAPLLLMFGA